MGQRISAIIAILFAGFVYLVSIFVLRAVSKEDVLQLPKGEKIAKILTKFSLIK